MEIWRSRVGTFSIDVQETSQIQISEDKGKKKIEKKTEKLVLEKMTIIYAFGRFV
jgi:hypothetical protein